MDKEFILSSASVSAHCEEREQYLNAIDAFARRVHAFHMEHRYTTKGPIHARHKCIGFTLFDSELEGRGVNVRYYSKEHGHLGNLLVVFPIKHLDASTDAEWQADEHLLQMRLAERLKEKQASIARAERAELRERIIELVHDYVEDDAENGIEEIIALVRETTIPKPTTE